MSESNTRRGAWALAGFLFILLLPPRTGQTAVGFLVGALVLGIVAAGIAYLAAAVLDRWLWCSRAALPFKQMSLNSSLVFLILVYVSVHLRFYPLAILLGADTSDSPLIALGTIAEIIISLIPILMVLFGSAFTREKS